MCHFLYICRWVNLQLVWVIVCKASVSTLAFMIFCLFLVIVCYNRLFPEVKKKGNALVPPLVIFTSEQVHMYNIATMDVYTYPMDNTLYTYSDFLFWLIIHTCTQKKNLVYLNTFNYWIVVNTLSAFIITWTGPDEIINPFMQTTLCINWNKWILFNS